MTRRERKDRWRRMGAYGRQYVRLIDREIARLWTIKQTDKVKTMIRRLIHTRQALYATDREDINQILGICNGLLTQSERLR